MAEQAVRKAVAAYSKGADRSDLDILKFASHDDAEEKYGSYDGHLAMKCASHTVLNQYCEIDANISRGRGRNLRSCFSINISTSR